MGSTSRRHRVSKKPSKVFAPPKKASHRRPHKPFDPSPPIPLVPTAHIQRAEDNDLDKYNTHNPFDHDIPLHDVTGQPQRLPRGVIACPTGGVVCARLLYPTPEEFSKMHAVKPANRFGRARNPASSSSVSPAATSAPPTSTSSAGATVAALVEQLKAEGLDPEDEIMLAHLKTLDMEGRFREDYHNAAEACERAEALHPMHRKLVRYRRARRDGALSRGDYAELKREVALRRREERRAREEEEARKRMEEERVLAEEEARERVEEERVRAEIEARRREEKRLRAEEEARREAERREEEARRRQWEMEQQRLFEECERARLEEIRERERVQALRRQWEAEQEQWRREEEERRRIATMERERRDRSMIRRWTVEREQEEWQARFEREVREYNESVRRVREFEENQRIAKILEDIRRYRVEAVASYESLWKKLRARQCPPQCFSFDNFPLPIFCDAGKPDLDKITPKAVAEFVLSPLRTDAHIKSHKNRVKDELLLWHPDKFSSVILPTVREIDREKMMVAADNIIKILNDMNEKL